MCNRDSFGIFTSERIHLPPNQWSLKHLGSPFGAVGNQLGEVVMSYSYRGVDLVVTVMGILKAGATFSVIDPSYPPDRQNI
jgi:non-ribosomal peptide synthetase component F